MIQNNPYKNVRVEFHILQSFPVTCLNRDDVGAPKTAMVGGTTRARVSSQCWKRNVRMAMHDNKVKTGYRTKHISTIITNACKELGAGDDKATECGSTSANFLSKIDKEGKSETLFFLSPSEATAIAEFCKEKGFDSKELKEKEIIAVVKRSFNPAVDGLDIALFGRMVAQAPKLNVEAAASFSHAISTHKVTNEVEFFTALDDAPDPDSEQGSAHMGSLEFNSATYYRYISLDIGQLVQTLGGDDFLKNSIEGFIKALYLAVPSARQASQSGASPWEYARVYVRKGQRLQVPFETAVKAKDGGFLEPSKSTLNEYLDKKEKLSGSLFGKLKSDVFGEDESFNIDNLIESVSSTVAAVKA